ncbi:MAG: alkyl hydroperoxide reductase subunit F [Parcubacteria group bacterium Gr01-1014_20]|nr:MAG: alkyl hydroperoxide reductase subunit F [Parcubacteria group bacterium Gr01-1014_20]
MYELLIIGGGPGGVAAGVYAARKKIKTALITETFGGQSLVSADVQNWIGTKSISGFDLGQNLESHLRAQAEIEIFDGDLVMEVGKTPTGFKVSTKNGKALETKYILVTSGSRRRRLGIPGENEHEGKGVAYCSICDAPLFGGKTVAVVGGGNAGLEAVIDLLPYAPKIYVLEFSDSLKADPVTQEKIKTNPKVEIITMAQTLEILGKENVTGVKYLDRKNNETKELAVEGIFVEIGITPNTEFVKGFVELNKFGEITTDPKNQKTSVPGIWAAGDATDVLYKQNNISAGDAVKAVLNIYEELNRTKN